MTAPASILLAAGAARRYGSCKQLLDINGVPMVRHTALAILAADIELTVITGANATEISAALDGLAVRLLHNPDWMDGMGSSIARGFGLWLQHPTPPAAALLCLADQPRVGTTQIRRMIERHQQQPQSILIADYGEAQGPPGVFPAWTYPELATLSGDQGARSLLRNNPSRVIRINMPEAGLDIDSPQDYQKLQRGAT